MHQFNQLITCIFLFLILGCGGGGGSGNDNSSTQNPPPTPIADFQLTDHKLRIYNEGDSITYSMDFESTYYDGSGSIATGTVLDWDVLADPDAFTIDEQRFSLISQFSTTVDRVVDIQRRHRITQPVRDNDAINDGAYRVYYEFDPILIDFGVPSRNPAIPGQEITDKWFCTNLDITDNLCYGLFYSPGTFSVGVNYQAMGFTSRTGFLDEYQDVDISWNIENIEIIDTPMGSFEAYKQVFTKDVSLELIGTRTFYTLSATYWYFPTIGIVKAEVVETKRFSGETTPYLTLEYSYEIGGTNIGF